MEKEFIDGFNIIRDKLSVEFGELNDSLTYDDVIEVLFNNLSVVMGENFEVSLLNTPDDAGVYLVRGSKQNYKDGRVYYEYWMFSVIYGTCSSCDSLRGILEASVYDPNLVVVMCLHIVQSIRRIMIAV